MISSPGDLGEDANEIWDQGNEVEDVKSNSVFFLTFQKPKL